jgi:23S rRNA pseudouridine1911/1915/1917 synthase
VTHYRTIEKLNNAALVECRLETGRTHQVRVHMQSLGHALLGDPVYGRTRVLKKPCSMNSISAPSPARGASGFIHPIAATL